MSHHQLLARLKARAISLLLKLPGALFLWLLAGWAAGYFGTLHWRFEQASNFKPQYFFGSLAFAAVFAAMKRWRWMFAALCCASIVSASIIPWYLPKAGTSAKMDSSRPGDQRLRVLFSNVLFTNQRHEPLIDLIRAENPDLIFPQEITPSLAEALNGIREAYPHGVIKPGEHADGIAALSRLPLVKAEDAGIGEYMGPSLDVRLQLGDRLLHILSTHTPPPRDDFHLRQRNENLRVLTERIQTLSAPKIVIGDLNVTMWSPYYQSFIETSGLVNAREGFGLLPSWPSDSWPLRIPIDHCLVSSDVRVINLRTGPNIGSDHLPLIAELAIPPGK
jgi:endonuclease/exonuclease/phosphatase (EEP) superfamily protein YafD